MKDITTTSFGLIIAYLLPGVASLCCIAMWWQPCHDFLDSCKASQANVGSFLFAVLVSLIAGLELNAVRWFVYERVFLRRHKTPPDYFVRLSEENRVLAIHATIDENFRYHQFYGAMSLIVPVLSIGLAQRAYASFEPTSTWPLRFLGVVGVAVLCVAVECVTVYAAITSFRRYIDRSTAIMKGQQDAKRTFEGKEAEENESGEEESNEEEIGEEEGG